jgi:hypothetical protein
MKAASSTPPERIALTGKEGREHQHQPAHALRVVADELGPLRVVAHRIGNATERRVRQREHRHHAGEAPDRDQVVHLNVRAKGPARHAEERRPGCAVAADAGLAAEEAWKHQRGGKHHLAEAQRDHGKRRARLARGEPAEDEAEQQACQPAYQRQQRHWERELPLADEIQGVNGEVRSKA